MKRILFVLFAAFVTLTAAAQSPVVQARLEPAKGILVGQPVRMVVTVYVPNYFTGSPDFPEFEMENAIVVLPQDRPENSNTQIGGVRYAGITETYVIYPQQASDFHLPHAQITVPYAVRPPTSTTARVSLPALSFHADIPAAARDLDYFLPTTGLTIQQKWSAPLKNLRAGDSIERTITVTATKMQAMLIPPLPLNAPDGIRVYPDEPMVQDQKTDRGDFIYGRRTQAAKYFIQKEGDYTLPPIELKWWNLSTNRLVTAVLPATHFTAAANPGYVAELPPEPEPAQATPVKHVSLWQRYRSRILLITPYCIAAIVLLWIAWHYLPRVLRWLRMWREQRKHSEAACFRNLQIACLHNDAAQTYGWLLKWQALAYPGRSLQQVLEDAENPPLSSEANNLAATLFAKGQRAPWAGRKFAALLKQQRRAYSVRSSKRYLQNLNPG